MSPVAQTLRALAIGACGVMAVAMILLQTVLTPDAAAPWVLFVIFLALWAFGAVMLVVAPRFGAAGTTAWGLVSAIGSYRTHAVGLSAENAFLIVMSLVASALALAYLVTRVRTDGARAHAERAE